MGHKERRGLRESIELISSSPRQSFGNLCPTTFGSCLCQSMATSVQLRRSRLSTWASGRCPRGDVDERRARQLICGPVEINIAPSPSPNRGIPRGESGPHCHLYFRLQFLVPSISFPLPWFWFHDVWFAPATRGWEGLGVRVAKQHQSTWHLFWRGFYMTASDNQIELSLGEIQCLKHRIKEWMEGVH
jgi:hypothetical protein